MEVLDFEQPLFELEEKINALKKNTNKNNLKILQNLEKEYQKLLKNVYSNLTAWQRVQVARHPKRPKSLFYIEKLFSNNFQLEGDRIHSKDESIIVQIVDFRGMSLMVIAQEKGVDLETRKKHNFGMVKPAGYRKVKRCVDIANRWNLPVVTFIDTPGAYAAKEAEEFGQAESIAASMAAFFKLEVPVVACVIGEGGSGGAIAIGVANKVIMLENSVYSIASPEAVSSILFKTAEKRADAAESLKLTAKDLQKSGYVDVIIPEPPGGAHRHAEKIVENLGNQLFDELVRLKKMDNWLLLKAREERFLKFGRVW